MRKHPRCLIFETSLGWMAAVWSERVLQRLTFGHRTPQAAMRQLADSSRDLSACDPVLDTDEASAYMRSLARRLKAFVAGDCGDPFLDVTLELAGMTPFQKAVIDACRRIPIGETVSYGELSRGAGHSGAARAVGQVMATNRFPLIVPCHRVVSVNSPGGFSAPLGLSMKRRLLTAEADYVARVGKGPSEQAKK
jgi:methylated-DNA-[protein]-cysteine S-methyltransferase